MTLDFKFYLTLDVNRFVLTYERENEICGINFIESRLWDENRNSSWQRIRKLIFLKQLKVKQIQEGLEVPVPYIEIKSSKKFKDYLDVLKICGKKTFIKDMEFSFNG